MSKPLTERGPAPFVTFYSFKGGVGRSMALINVAGILAGRGFRVLAIDLDLEAPGISYLIPSESDAKVKESPVGFVELLADAVARGPESDLLALDPGEVVELYSGAFKVPEQIRHSAEGFLRIMSAGLFDGGYQRRLDELDLPGLYRDGRGQELVRAFKKTIQDSNVFDFVLVDSRTGFSDESGICTRDLADHLMVVTGLNRQNIEGTAEFLRVLRLASDGNKSLQIILSPVPTGEDELVDQRERIAGEKFAEAWGEELDLSLQIPYHPRLALTEEPHIFRRSRGYLFDAYMAIERQLLARLGLTAKTVIEEASKHIKAERYDRGLASLKLAIKLDDGRSNLGLLNYNLLDSVRSDSKADALYAFLAKELPASSWMLLSWAVALFRTGNDLAGAFFDRALEITPEDPVALFNYARFLDDVRGDHVRAEQLSRRVCEIEFVDLKTNLGSHAKVLFVLNRQEEAMDVLSKAFAAPADNEQADGNNALLCQVNFYAYAHAWQKWPEALGRLKGLLLSGARSKGWKLDANVERARKQGHPEPALVAALAKVISKQARIKMLNKFTTWTGTPPVPPTES
jgi:MinD-like ATPase involved in chromosome partitioning or flagellar assembly